MVEQHSRVLVTGGAGFIGSELVRILAKHGHTVVVVDNLVNGTRDNLAGVLAERVSLQERDIRDLDRMSELMATVDIVYHLACLGVRHSIHSPLENQDVNASATLSLLELARNSNVNRFVHVSSSEVYGTAKSVPMAESHQTVPHTIYGGSKLAGESYARAYWKTYQFPTVIVRPFNSYGPRSHHEGDSGEVIPKFLLRVMAGKPMIIFGDGTQTRDFTFVSDTARGIYEAGIADKAVGRTINLGQGVETEINELAQLVAEVADAKGEAQIEYQNPRPGDVHRLLSNSEYARELLDFRPRVGLRDGLTRLREWYLSGGRSPEELLEDDHVRNWERQ
ncbi:GDP-mannose 4,6-dehydratase [bacterium]|nr:GDP-mannose 4,6-dehydratase [bacterium]